eukprot:CAMPEP_0197388672 /NCGR_PEP_ID=MMETSP1165-20131217/1203_1 /TAXON_ID=284809 /ORGANISM="Chrysocystis fragilis, Strain CCMP3189" /LENGTH=338 /DNA_ID=CAMNT_0042914023 /DNA_START=17 /DNA_END=1033 /DNA_ORIENTATION=+
MPARMWWILLLGGAGPTAGLNFLSVGDWGDTEAKAFTASLMGEAAGNLSAQFVLAIGDNMYDTGVSSVDDPQFASKFEETFTASSLQVPWYVVGGNHDYYGSISAQVEYTNKSDRWTFPELYYTKYLEDSDASLTIVAIDTWRLNGGDTYVAYDPRTNRGVIRDPARLERDLAEGTVTRGTFESITRNFAKDAEIPATVADQEQLDQIEAWLRDANSTWTVVVGHFPVYSATLDEHGDTPALVQSLAPLLAQYGVDVYFSGHDHVLQHISKDGVAYLGSGAGAREHSGMNASYDGLVAYADGKFGFMTHELDATSLKTTFVVNDKGAASKPYTFTISK